MRKLVWMLVLGLFGLAAPALAANDKPLIGPPAAWVRPTPIPTPKDERGGPFRSLLSDEQASFGPDGDAYYVAYATRLQTAAALTGGGSVAMAWDPEIQTLTVHKVRILRGDTVIDVLAKQSFTVLRRETKLEWAQLDGTLTATLQVEGLQVGDILDVAYTSTDHDPAMQGRSNLVFDWPKYAVDRAVVRATWAAPKTMQWKVAGGQEAPTITRKGGVTELVIDRSNVQTFHPPAGAPRRYSDGPQLELTEFKTWADASALMRPLYDRASQLQPDSPLKAEVAKIRSASSDPKVQAGAALSLVESQVRYLYLGMKDGGYVPADADLTWSRRFGDCKGKTVLLLALLHELGIEAEPALVSTFDGDGLDARLPTLARFDHVMVRAVIAGKTYWLDGTRTDDRDLDRLKIPNFHWSLPERPAGAVLVKLDPPPAEQPELASILSVDASAGLDAPAVIHAEEVARGDTARALNMAMSSLSATDRDKALRDSFTKTYPKIVITGVSVTMDAQTDEYRMIIDGKTPLEWKPPSNIGYRFLTMKDGELGWTQEFKRDPGPMADAPYAAICGPYTLVKETVVLPRGGAGFSFPAPDVDQQVAGCALSRHSHLEKGVLTMERSSRTVTSEFPASEAAAANKTLAELAKTQVFLRSPPNYVATDSDIAVMAATEPTTTAGYINRGNSYSARREYNLAIADYAKAIALNPKDSAAIADRGLAYLQQNKDDLARADLEAAAKLNPRDVAAVHGQGLLAIRAYRYRDAIANFSRAVDLKADNTYALNLRANLYIEVGEYDHALADLDELLRIVPGNPETHLRKSRLLAAQGDRKAAAAETEAALKIDPANLNGQILHGGELIQAGQRAEGMAVLASAIAVHPRAGAYLARAGSRERSDRSGRRADIEAALKADPKSTSAQMLLADVRSEAGAHAEAIASLTAGLKANPGNESLLLGRARAYARSGDIKSADSDLKEIEGKEAANPGMLNNLCFTRATYGVELSQALTDCDRSLAINPTSPATLDSRAFVLLRLGRLEEAVTAYDAALKLRPELSSSLYGRGVAKARLQRTKEGEADMAAGKAISPEIAETFAEWGVPAPAAGA